VKNKRLLKLLGAIGLVVILMALLMGGCAKPAPTPAPAPAPAPTPSPAPAPTPAPTPELESFTLKMGVPYRPNEFYDKGFLLPVKDFIEEFTEGRCEVEIYYNSALNNWKDAYEAVDSGINDLTEQLHQTTPGMFPLHDLFTLPGLAANVITTNAVQLELMSIYPQFREQYGDNVIPATESLGMRSDLHTLKPIRSLEELKGKVIACSSESGVVTVNALGASGTVMVGADVYTAAQTGAIDGAFCAWGFVWTAKLHEVLPYHTLLELSPCTTAWITNKKTWDSFSPREQKIMEAFGRNMMMRANRCQVVKSMRVRDLIAEDHFFQFSVEDMNKIQELFKPSWEKWANDVEALGYPGHDILKDYIRLRDGFNYG